MVNILYERIGNKTLKKILRFLEKLKEAFKFRGKIHLEVLFLKEKDVELFSQFGIVIC